MGDKDRRRKLHDYDYLLKLVLIGDPGVGKSALLLRYVDNVFNDNYTCTIGVDFKLKTLNIKEKSVKLQIWDTAGQERFKPITTCYYRGAHGCIVAYDITNRESFNNLKVWVEEFREMNGEELEGNIIIIGNKSDKEEERKVSFEEGQRIAHQYDLTFLETSSKDNAGVDEAFLTMANEVLTKINPDELEVDRKYSFKIRGMPLQPEDAENAENQTRPTVSPKKKKSACCKG